ncbi:hypothetical protein MYAM1_003218 [Malassezia yamatoensis]|uniref:Glycoside hydrolase family 5 C-terminal domain-containing protein n=1 Tax=Malassezia yamatoensis TaxID=253288 RepID=A0AAJ6CJ47_9BASI|nr:hypothetical protein MYAM1_003218 [Malassezia yamatoensis]
MEQYGLKCIICAHQDVWSRLCGGSGAPGWTLLAAGFDLTHLNATGSALIPDFQDNPLNTIAPPGKKEPTGAFNWPSGYQKLAPATMATLFWAGRTYAPNFCLHKDNAGNAKLQNIQDFLQESYMAAYTLLIQAVSSCEAYLGFDVINEPHRGLINLTSFHQWCYETDLHIGHFPPALQSMALGDGHPQSIPFYAKSWPFPSRISHTSHITPAQSVWLDPSQNPFSSTRTATGCLWREHGVWAWDESKQKPVVLQADYFSVDPRAGHHRRPVEFYSDFYAPFVNRLADRMHRICPEAMLLVEPIPNEFMPRWNPHAKSTSHTVDTTISAPLPRNFVYAPHFYDLNVLFFKAYSGFSVNVQGLSRGMFILRAIYFGTQGLAKNYYYQLKQLTTAGYDSLGRVPIVVGEVGIPFDVNNTLQEIPGNYRVQNQLLGALVSALERNLISFTLWNYNPRNTVEQGDAWNQEDFSLINLEAVAADQGNLRRDEILYRGGRAIDAVLRPYVCKIDGVPLSTYWDAGRSTLEFHWRNLSQSSGQPTEVYVPDYHARGLQLNIRLSDGTYRYDEHLQTLYISHSNLQPNARHSLFLSILKDRPSDNQGIVTLVLCGLLAVVVAYLALDLRS